MRLMRVLGLTFIFCLTLSAAYAGDPTLDRLMDNMTNGDASFADKQKAKQQLHYLCRYGHEELLFPYLDGKSFLNQLAALDVAMTLKATKKLTDAVAAKLKTESEIVKRRAAITLGIFGTKESSVYLLASLSGEPATRATILNALAVARHDVGGKAIGAQLTDEKSDKKLRWSAANALFECKVKGEEDAAKKALEKEKDEFVKTVILAYLVVVKDAAGDTLASYIENEDYIIRSMVVKAYTRSKNNSLVSACAKAMGHRNEYIRLAAARGFTGVGLPKDITQILTYLEDKDPKVRVALSVALRKISKRNFGFNGFDSKNKRAKAAARWREWWFDNAYSYNVKVN